MTEPVGIIGAGAWGTAIAISAAGAGHGVRLWHRDQALVDHLRAARTHPALGDDLALPGSVEPVADIERMLGCAVLVLAIPSQALADVAMTMADGTVTDAPMVIAAKGFERPEGRLLSEGLRARIPGATIAILSGPTFASELARGKPAAATLACRDRAAGAALAKQLSSPTLRLYWTDDMIGAQVGGAVKNVLAIACGIAIGLGLGENARAALLTRGMAEIERLNRALGGRAETLTGLSGLGDIMLTCSSDQSRNFALGLAIGEAGEAEPVLAQGRVLVEGVPTARALAAMAGRLRIDMPIARAVDALLHGGAAIGPTADALFTRPLKAEAR